MKGRLPDCLSFSTAVRIHLTDDLREKGHSSSQFKATVPHDEEVKTAAGWKQLLTPHSQSGSRAV